MLSRLKAQKAKGCIRIEEWSRELRAGGERIRERAGREGVSKQALNNDGKQLCANAVLPRPLLGGM